MEAPSFDRDGRMAETFTWSGSKIPFFLFSTFTFLILMTWGRWGWMDYVCFFVSATGRRKMTRVDEIEIREEEQWLDSQSILRKRRRKAKQANTFTELS